MEVASPGVPNGLAPSNPLPADPSIVIQFLTDALQSNLDAHRTDLENHGSFLSKQKYSETLQRCARFASESQIALYVLKDAVDADDSDESEEPNGTENGSRMSLYHHRILDTHVHMRFDN